MKTNFIKTLFVTLFLLSVNIVNAHDFVSNGIYYDITDATNKTVAVTYKGIDCYSYSNEYTGSVVIPESVSYNGKVYSVTSIGNYAFVGCSGLTSIKIPNSVTSIGEWAFSYCSGLTSITIPNSVTSIGDEAFNGCSGLTSIVIPNSVTSIGDEAFNGTAWYNNQPDGVVYAGNVLYKYKGTMPSYTSVVVKEGTLGIAEYAFEDCSGLTSVEIPNSVTSISDYAFRGCTSLKSIAIPNSVTDMEQRMFEGCTSLVSATIGDNADEIDYDTFAGCVSLKSVTIGKKVRSIDSGAFEESASLSRVYCKPITVPSIYNSFDDCDLSTLKIYVPTERLEVYKADYNWSKYADNIVGHNF